jgi:mannose-6-phosphate isomerase-like protein (cupin superfamily)
MRVFVARSRPPYWPSFSPCGKGGPLLPVRRKAFDLTFVVPVTSAADSGGQLSLVEVPCAPGYKGVRHLHQNEDEGFWIIEGLLDSRSVEGT